MRPRPAYIEDKIALERARREHRAHPPRGCRCPLCLSPEEWRAFMEAVKTRDSHPIEEVPF